MNKTQIPVIFFHIARNEYFKGFIMETATHIGAYWVMYRDIDNVLYKVAVKYNNCIIMDMSFHPVMCEDKIPTV